MNKKMVSIAFAISLTLGACSEHKVETNSTAAATKVASANTNVTESSSAADIRKSAYDIATRSGAWQIAQLGNLSYIPESHRLKSENAKFWIQAAFYIGLTKWTQVSQNEAFLAHLGKMAKEEEYGLLTTRPYHADDHTIGQTYLWLTEQTGNKDAYKPTQEHFDWILANKPNVGLEMLDSTSSGSGKVHHEGNCQLRWCWADALFMAPRTWLQLSNATGDPKYFEYADQEFWAAADYLFSDKYGLFFRDSRYFEMKSDNGEPVFWGRGNGWVFAAIPLILDDLPKDHPSRPR